MLLTIYGSLFFIHVAVVACKIWEIPRKLELIGLAVQGHPRSSVLVPIEREHSNLLLATLIVTLDVSLTVFEILTNKARKWVVFPPLLCLTPPLGETCQNFWMKLTPQKQKDVATIWWKFHDPNFTDFYRAMHFSAKRGIAIACRLSVRLSVTLVDCDHIGWNSSKIISPLVSRDVRSLQPQHDGCAPRGTPLNLDPKRPTPCWFERQRHAIANCGRMLTDSTTVTMESV